MQKRRSFNERTRSTSESTSTKFAPLISATDNNNLTETEIIERAQNGDVATFEQLYRRHGPRVYAVCVRMIKDPAEAEDLTQEAFMLLFRKIHLSWRIGFLHLAAPLGRQPCLNVLTQEVIAGRVAWPAGHKFRSHRVARHRSWFSRLNSGGFD